MDWQRRNRERTRKIQLNHYYRHQDERQEAHRVYAKRNRPKETERLKKWRRENPLEWKELRKKAFQKKYATPRGKLDHTMSGYLWHGLKCGKNWKSWTELVGYSLHELFDHLNTTIPEGYNWNEYLSGKLHIDHIIPRSAFNFKNHLDIDFKKCWELKNLRLLPAKENMSKGAKLDKQFQPSLAFGG